MFSFFCPPRNARSTFGTRISNSGSSWLFSHLRCLWRVLPPGSLGLCLCQDAHVQPLPCCALSPRLSQPPESRWLCPRLIAFYLEPTDSPQGHKSSSPEVLLVIAVIFFFFFFLSFLPFPCLVAMANTQEIFEQNSFQERILAPVTITN